jgi:Fur family transcriptional regulator, ferric uptake regulator
LQHCCIYILVAIVNTVDELLYTYHLNKTPCRTDVLKALTTTTVALSEKEIKAKLTFDYDRSTLFRTIRKFLHTGIIHRVTIDGQDVRYAINHQPAAETTHYHAHFHCGQCNSVVCLDHVSVQQPNIPEGFLAEEFNLVINGKCPDCKN